VIRILAVALAFSLSFVPAAVHAEDEGSPHHMTKPDGSLNMDICGACHNPDMSLQRSKLETCTLCHAPTVHAGSNEHLSGSPAAVKSALAQQPKGAPALPLTDDGHIYCGTCHFFHDPKVMEEKWLTQGWLPADAGVSGAIRKGVIDRWAALAATAGEKDELGQFATKGTRQLRIPAEGGQLCRQCHGTPP